MRSWRIGLGAALAGAALAAALVLDTATGGWALYLYALLLAAALFLVILRDLRHALVLAPDLDRFRPGKRRAEDEVAQYAAIRRQLLLSRTGESEARIRLGSLAREIAEARLARFHGVDLQREPEKARSVMGGGTAWRLVRPEDGPAGEKEVRPWSAEDTERLIEELEAL